MTPEERFSKIDKLMRLLHKRQAKVQVKVKVNGRPRTAQIEKQNAEIRALVVDSRKLLESQKRARKARRKSERETGDKLKALKDLVGGTIRKRPRKKNS